MDDAKNGGGKAKPSRTAGFYKSYNFLDKDPVIDEIRTVLADTGLTHKEIERRSGVVPATLNNWFKGRTKRPQHATARAVLRAMGYDYAIVPLQRDARMEIANHAQVQPRAVPKLPGEGYKVPARFSAHKAVRDKAATKRH